jgi:hypothetical protein
MLGRSPDVDRRGDRCSCLSMVVLLPGNRLCGSSRSPSSSSECVRRRALITGRPGSVDARGMRVLVSGVDQGRWASALRGNRAALDPMPTRTQRWRAPDCRRPGHVARRLRRRLHDSAIYCATTAGEMQMRTLRVRALADVHHRPQAAANDPQRQRRQENVTCITLRSPTSVAPVAPGAPGTGWIGRRQPALSGVAHH